MLAGEDVKLWACKREGLFDSARHFMWIMVIPDTLQIMRLHGISKQIKVRPQTRRLPLTSLPPFFINIFKHCLCQNKL